MQLLKDIVGTIFGVKPNYLIGHDHLRGMTEIGSNTFVRTSYLTLCFYDTLFIDYGSTIECDELTQTLMTHLDPDGAEKGKYDVPGSSLADQWFNSVNPSGKKRRDFREGILLSGDSTAPQALFCYYRSGSFQGEKLCFMIVDNLNVKRYGTSIENVRFGFDAQLKNWSPRDKEFSDLLIRRLWVNGERVVMNDSSVNASLKYAQLLIQQLKAGDFNPEKSFSQINLVQPTIFSARKERRLTY